MSILGQTNRPRRRAIDLYFSNVLTCESPSGGNFVGVSVFYNGLFSTKPPLSYTSERVFAREKGNKAKNTSVEQDLPKFKIYPIPEQ